MPGRALLRHLRPVRGGPQDAVQTQDRTLRGGQLGAGLVVDAGGEVRGGRHGARMGDGDLPVGGVADVLVLSRRPPLEQSQQLGDQHRIVAPVVHPAPPQHAVLHGAHEGVLRPLQRGAPVGERHQIGGRFGAGGVVDHDELHPDLALRVVQPEPSGIDRLGPVHTPAVPRTRGQPRGQELQFGRLENGLVDHGHVEDSFPSHPNEPPHLPIPRPPRGSPVHTAGHPDSTSGASTARLGQEMNSQSARTLGGDVINGAAFS
ncbi:hypothetical protein STAL104432_13710 [Streptomyces albus]